MKPLNLLCLFAVLVVGCAKPQGNDRLEEKAKIDAQNQTNADVTAQDEKAKKMEADLARIQNFYQGVRGIYEGRMKMPSGSKFLVRLNIHPNIERYEGDRIRSLDEIANELKSLAFDVVENTITVMSDGSELSFGCSFASIRPGVDRGFFTLEGGCPRSFAVNLLPASSVAIADHQKLEVVSRSVAKALLDENLSQVKRLQVEMRSVNIPNAVMFTLERVR